MTVYINGTDTLVGGYTEGAHVHHSVDQTATHQTDLYIAFDTEEWDTDGIHDNAINNSRLTCRTAGKYLITGFFAWRPDGVGVGIRVAKIRLNSLKWLCICEQVNMEQDQPGNENDSLVTTIWDMEVNDYVELVGWQNSGGDLDVDSLQPAQYRSPRFMMQRIG